MSDLHLLQQLNPEILKAITTVLDTGANLPIIGPGAGTYGGGANIIGSVTLDAQGRVTALTTTPGGSGSGYNTIDAAGTALTARQILNFAARLTAVDNVGATRTDVDLATTGVSAGTYNSVTVNTFGLVTAGSSVGNITGTGTTNNISKWTSSTAQGNSNLSDDGTTVTLAANIALAAAAGTGTFNFSPSSGTFATSTGTNTLSGSVSIAANKNITAAAGTGAFDFSAGSGLFKTSTGTNTLSGNVSIAANKSLSMVAGTGVVDFSASTGTFDSSGGLVTLHGETHLIDELHGDNFTYNTQTTGFHNRATFSTTWAPPSGNADYSELQLNLIVNGTSSGKATSLAIAQVTNTLVGGTIWLIDAGTSTTDYATGYTQKWSLDINGNTSQVGTITSTITDATTNSPTIVESLVHKTSGTPSIGIGTSLRLRTQQADSTVVTAGQINGTLTDVTNGASIGQLDFQVLNAGTLGSGMTLTGRGDLIVNGTETLPSISITNTSGNLTRYTQSTSLTPASGTIKYISHQINPTINGTSSGFAKAFVIASAINTLTGGTILLADFGTTTTDGFTGFTSKWKVDTAGLVTQASGLTISAGNFDQSASSGTFATGTGAVSLNGAITVASAKSLTSAGGAANFDWSASSGTFQTGTGLTTTNGDLTVVGLETLAAKTFNATSGNSVRYNQISSFTPASGTANYISHQVNPTINGVSSGFAKILVVASKTNTLTGGTILLADLGTTTTDGFTGFTSQWKVDTTGAVTQAGGLTVSAGGITITSGSETITAGNLTISAGTQSTTIDDASNSSVTNVATLVHTTSGTAAAGIGTGVLLRTENASGTTVDAGRIATTLTTATAASEASNWVFQTRTAGAALADAFKIDNAGNITNPVSGSFTITNTQANSGSNTGFIMNSAVALAGSTNLLDIQNNGTSKVLISQAGVITLSVATAGIGLASGTFVVFTSTTIGSLCTSGGGVRQYDWDASSLRPNADLGRSSGDSTHNWTATFQRHSVSAGATPTNTAGTGAGTSPTVTITGNDYAGTVQVLTGTTPTGSNANVVTVTFAAAYGVAPKAVVLFPGNATTAAAIGGATEVFVDSTTITTAHFIVVSGTTALTAATTYLWFYIVIG